MSATATSSKADSSCQPESEEVKSKSKAKLKRARASRSYPPCVICGANATGLHYGVNCCEACKAFYYRNVDRAHILSCDMNNDCRPEPGSGFSCAACRMKTCIGSGMSNKGIKKGRYTYERKSQLKRNILNPVFEKKNTFDFAVTSLSTDSVNVDSIAQLATADPRLPVPCITEPVPRTPNIVSTVVSTSPYLTDTYVHETLQMLQKLEERYTPYPHDFFDKVHEVQRVYLERKAEKSKLFGTMTNVSSKEFFEIYNKTGIDVDGRLRKFNSFFPQIEVECHKYIEYATNLPHFQEFSNEDQISMLKGAKAGFWMLTDYKGVDTVNFLLTLPNYDTLNKDDMLVACTEDYLASYMKITKHLQDCKMTESEENVFKAILIFNKDYCVTDKGRLHAKQQEDKYTCILKYLILRHHPLEMSLLTDLDSLKKDMCYIEQHDQLMWRNLWHQYAPVFDNKFSTSQPLMRKLYDEETLNDTFNTVP